MKIGVPEKYTFSIFFHQFYPNSRHKTKRGRAGDSPCPAFYLGAVSFVSTELLKRDMALPSRRAGGDAFLVLLSRSFQAGCLFRFTRYGRGWYLSCFAMGPKREKPLPAARPAGIMGGERGETPMGLYYDAKCSPRPGPSPPAQCGGGHGCSTPAFHALVWHRIAHFFFRLHLFFLARLFFPSWGRFFTGVEIHPGARIGRGLFMRPRHGHRHRRDGRRSNRYTYSTIYHNVTWAAPASMWASATRR